MSFPRKASTTRKCPSDARFRRAKSDLQRFNNSLTTTLVQLAYGFFSMETALRLRCFGAKTCGYRTTKLLEDFYKASSILRAFFWARSIIVGSKRPFPPAREAATFSGERV